MNKPLVNKVIRRWDANGAAEEEAAKLSRRGVAEAIRDGFRLRDASPATWAALVAHPFWDDHPKQRPKAGDREDAVNYVIAIHFGEVNRASKRVSDYRLAVAQLQNEGLDDDAVIKAIRSGPTIADILARRRQPENGSGPRKAKAAPKPDKAEKPASASTTAFNKPSSMTFVLTVGAKKLSELTSAKLPAKFRLEVDIDAFNEGQAVGMARKLKVLVDKTKSEKTSAKP